MASIHNLLPFIYFNGTKTNVEAGSATVSQTYLAYATDSREVGIYAGGSWTWTGAPAGQYRQFTYSISGGTFSFIVDGGGTPVMALQNLE